MTKVKKQTLPYPGAVYDTSRVNDTGNVFGWLGGCSRALRRAGAPQELVDEFLAEAKSGDYDYAIQTCFKYVEVI